MIVEECGDLPVWLRQAYLGSLGEPQELYVETLVRSGRPLLLHQGEQGQDGAVTGYAVVSDGVVVEFHLGRDAWSELPAAFGAVLDHSGAGQALCKTFDPLMLTAAASRPARTRTVGHLFRSVHGPGQVAGPEITARLAQDSDSDAILAIHDGFFDDPDEVERYVTEQALWLYETADFDVLGCGTLTRVIPGQDAVDVGMVVAPQHRRRGLGAAIVAHLKDRCLQSGDRPIAGCDAENTASRRALENAGFATAHSLIEFTY